jgi:heme exporter protein D
MKWASLSAFIAMGGYGLYVWGSYAVTAGVIALELWLLLARHRAARRGLGGTQEP